MLGAIPNGFVFVTGTNGKTTTVAMLSTILSDAGYDVLTNRTGSNLARGLLSYLLERTDALGRLRVESGSIGVFEVDEAALIGILPTAVPRTLVLTNLFRDQLDRYGEIDSLSRGWVGAIGSAGADLHVVANADDPAVMLTASQVQGMTTTFGVAGGGNRCSPDEWADSSSCPVCSSRLEYRYIAYSHLGDYACPKCGFTRPQVDFEATDITADGLSPAAFSIGHDDAHSQVHLKVPGIFNIYNALGAAAAAATLGVGVEDIVNGLGRSSPVFGRAERVSVGEVEIILLLAKNPTGANEILRTLRGISAPIDVLMALNDRAADGHDVSWIWDLDVQNLNVNRLTATGDRAEDLALRLKYGGVAGREAVTVERNLAGAFEGAIRRSEGMLYVIATYTAMLDLRALLVRDGRLEPYWSH